MKENKVKTTIINLLFIAVFLSFSGCASHKSRVHAKEWSNTKELNISSVAYTVYFDDGDGYDEDLALSTESVDTFTSEMTKRLTKQGYSVEDVEEGSQTQLSIVTVFSIFALDLGFSDLKAKTSFFHKGKLVSTLDTHSIRKDTIISFLFSTRYEKFFANNLAKYIKLNFSPDFSPGTEI